jgi:hypothetical protein
MKNVFNGYQNMIMNETLNVVVHEWAPNLNTSLETQTSKLLIFPSCCIIIILKHHSMCLSLMLFSHKPFTMYKDNMFLSNN